MKRLIPPALAAAVLGLGAMTDVTPDTALRGASAPFEMLRLSSEMARVGQANRDAWLLAVAARMRRQTPLRDVRRAPDGDAAPAGGPDPSDAWLDAAADIGAEDPRLQALVREVRATGFKGRAGGPQVSRARVRGGAAHRYGESFELGRPAVVYIEGDGDTDLDLVVRSPAGTSACTQQGPGDIKLCAWTATQSGRYAVEVVNRGRVDNAYAFATN